MRPGSRGAHRRPVSTPVLAAAVRAVLADGPGMFGPVAEHPATEAALVDAYRELAAVDDAALDALARTGRARRRRRAHHRAGRGPRSAPEWYDERDLMDAAVDAVGAGMPLLADLGAVVVHLPQELSAPAAALLRALGDTRAGHRRRRHHRRRARRRARARGTAASRRRPARGRRRRLPRGDAAVVSASDPDDEVRAVVRLVVDAVRDGVPLERMAVLYGAPEPYARLVHEQLDAAGIPHNGAAVRTLADSVLGRGLLGLLALPDRDFQRHDVMRAARAPAPVPSRAARARRRWERISRRARRSCAAPSTGTQRLERYAPHRWSASWRRSARSPTATRTPSTSSTSSRATRELQAFVADAGRRPRGRPRRASWRELAAWAERLVRDHLAPETRRGRLARRRAAGGREDRGRARPGSPGSTRSRPRPGVDVFRRTLELELDADLGRVGRFGDGLLMGHVALGLGLDLDRVFVCGLAEGLFPTRVRDDSLLPDADRRATDGALALRPARVDDDHRRLLAALASASQRARPAVPPRRPAPHHRAGAVALPAREHRRGEHGARLPTISPSSTPTGTRRCRRSPPGSRACEFPATEQEHRLRTLLDHARAGGAVDHARAARASTSRSRRGVETVGRRAAAASSRASTATSPATTPGRVTDGDVVVSPTRLQTYAANPFDYLLEYVLRVDIPELPEERYEVVAPRPRQPGARDARRVPERLGHAKGYLQFRWQLVSAHRAHGHCGNL